MQRVSQRHLVLPVNEGLMLGLGLWPGLAWTGRNNGRLYVVFAHLADDLIGDLRRDERLFDSLAQFDFLACVAGIIEAGSLDGRSWYPNFAKLDSHRTMPIVSRLVIDSDLRTAVAPVSDVDLAVIFMGMDRLAKKEGVMFSGWWGFDDGRVLDFINRNLQDEQAVAQSPFARGDS
jgi:hypothetical protein